MCQYYTDFGSNYFGSFCTSILWKMFIWLCILFVKYQWRLERLQGEKWMPVLSCLTNSRVRLVVECNYRSILSTWLLPFCQNDRSFLQEFEWEYCVKYGWAASFHDIDLLCKWDFKKEQWRRLQWVVSH